MIRVNKHIKREVKSYKYRILKYKQKKKNDNNNNTV